ncbi:2-oxoglutarate and iron-dependent oxygenase domain-containing protein [Xanthomonas oryzae]|uniref:2-oxoglutarate and iron-dependent oxygenase domain-containing protein n=1 Tax=Xanthomonas oryzae TaxID=347 RepID=UPI001F5F88DB|nr:2-oxoglutarate and iron-dependent oxygenase domain-containing protein [Xanthomonas oryzae]
MHEENYVNKIITFQIPPTIDVIQSHIDLGLDIIDAWRRDGIIQIALDDTQDAITQNAFKASQGYFALPHSEKSSHLSDLNYAGYIASGEEITAGKADYSEIYTVCKDLPADDARVQQQWPCHGPVPWPNKGFQRDMALFTDQLGAIGEKLLRLVALGLHSLGRLDDIDGLNQLTRDGWHHMRVLRFPRATLGNQSRGISSHTDYGMLVIAAQDDVGGLYIRPPVEGEVRRRNWLSEESAAGMYENEEPWTFVQPTPRVVTAFPGDIMQFLTGGYLLSTPHKVKLNTRERYALAYFHEPNFKAVIEPLRPEPEDGRIHYGSHFTNMFMRSYPQRITTQRILRENRLDNWLSVSTADPSFIGVTGAGIREPVTGLPDQHVAALGMV